MIDWITNIFRGLVRLKFPPLPGEFAFHANSNLVDLFGAGIICGYDMPDSNIFSYFYGRKIIRI